MTMSRQVRMSRVEHRSDGTTTQIDYEDAPLPDNDPSVRARQHRIGASSSEIITEFAPAPSRPLTYPVELPFLANRQVWTTESPDGSISPGARWPCTDSGVLAAAVIEASQADGWGLTPGQPGASPLQPPLFAVLSRRESTRLLSKFEVPQGGVIQLLDVVGDWLERSAPPVVP